MANFSFFSQQMKHPDVGVFVILIGCSGGLSNLFLYCFFGRRATTNYEAMADCLYESNWLDCPLKLQKCFVILITNTQRPLYYHGFNVALLNLETMTNVIGYFALSCIELKFQLIFFSQMLCAVYSYYMMFKTLTIG